MPQYKIEILETSSRLIDVEADSEDEALEKVEKMYEEEKIIIDWADFDGVVYKVIETSN